MLETTTTDTTISIDKNTQYTDLMNKVLPFTKSSNKMERKAAYDINYLLYFAINENKNDVLCELKSGIEHIINYFMPEINNLIDQTVSWKDSCVHYFLLQDIVRVIVETLLHKKNMKEFNDFLLKESWSIGDTF